MNACVLIPVYNHGGPLEGVINELVDIDLPCILIDDGSDDVTKATLHRLEVNHSWIRLETRKKNGGKGAALKDGYRLAHSLGYTHIFQIDADGQHNTHDLPRIAELAKAHPEAMVLIEPSFENAPKSRLYGRWISVFWVWVECCSTAICDPLCGYRAMPLAPLIKILDSVPCGDRMDFDPEIAVRMVWEGVPVINFPSQVRYDSNGLSHFDMWRDNMLISWSHTRLFFGMLLRFHRLVFRKVEIKL